MNPQNYKIIKFAIEHNNKKLFDFVLSKNELSAEQLSECLILADNKEHIFNELLKIIENNKINKELEFELSENECLFMDRFKNIHSKNNSKLLLAIAKNLMRNFDIPEELWTSEQVDKQNDKGWNVLHYLASNKDELRHDVANKHLERAIKLSKNPWCKNLKEEMPLQLAYDYENLDRFKLIWKYMRIVSSFASIVFNANGIVADILSYIVGRNNSITRQVVKFLLIDELYIKKDDSKNGNKNFNKILNWSLELSGARKELECQIRDSLLKNEHYTPDTLFFDWKHMGLNNIKLLLKSGKFIFDNRVYQLCGDAELIHHFIKHCPQNIKLNNRFLVSFNNSEHLMETLSHSTK